MGFRFYSLVFLQILCYSLSDGAPMKPSMLNEILYDRIVLHPDKIIQSIWQHVPLKSCDVEKPPETILTDKKYLQFNFAPYLCVILYDASIRYINLNISHLSNEVKGDIAEKIIEESSPDTFCAKMKENKWYTSIDDNKRWVSNFNDNMKNEMLCQRYCVSDVVNPLCAFTLWIDLAVKKVEHISSHPSNTKVQELPGDQAPRKPDLKQIDIKPPQSVNEQILEAPVGNDNSGVQRPHPGAPFHEHNTNTGTAMEKIDTMVIESHHVDSAIAGQPGNHQESRGHKAGSLMNSEGQSVAAGQIKESIPVANSSENAGPAALDKAAFHNDKSNAIVGKTNIPLTKPPQAHLSPDKLSWEHEKQHLDEPHGKFLENSEIHKPPSSQGNSNEVEGVRNTGKGLAQVLVPHIEHTQSGTTSSANAKEADQGSSQRINIENPITADNLPLNTELEEIVPNAHVPTTPAQNEKSGGISVLPVGSPDDPQKIVPPAISPESLMPEAPKKSESPGDKMTDKDNALSVVRDSDQETNIKEEPGSNKGESAGPKEPTVNQIEKSEPEDVNQANEGEIDLGGAAVEPDDHEEQKTLEEGAVGGQGEDSDPLGSRGDMQAQDLEDELGEQPEIATEDSRFGQDDDGLVKPDASTKLANNGFGGVSDEDDGLWSPGQSGRAVQNDADPGYAHDRFVDAEDSHFFAYFMTMIVLCIIGYLIFHNKQKILALALEGRVRKGSRRRPSTSGYRKLDSNLEEAVTSNCTGSSVTHVIY